LPNFQCELHNQFPLSKADLLFVFFSDNKVLKENKSAVSVECA